MKTIKLFDDMGRSETRVKRYDDSSFTYLNETARLEFAETRELLEEWFSRFPHPHRADVRSRFRSKSDASHRSAFWELFLHELLICCDCTLRIHPEMPSTNRKPDFLVEDGAGSFYLEAVTVPGKSDLDRGKEAVKQQLYDALDREIEATSFYLWLDVRGVPERVHSVKRIAKEINQQLRDLDPDEMTKLQEEKGIRGLPQWSCSAAGWTLLFRPIPKKAEARGVSGARPIGVRMGEFETVDHQTPLNEAITEKARAYGEMKLPYIVAVNALERIDEMDIEAAVFGPEKVIVRTGPGQPIVDSHTREWNGAFMSESGRKLSGVFVSPDVGPMTFDQQWYLLWHNPYGTYPHCSTLTRFDERRVVDGQKVVKRGLHPVEVLFKND